MTVRVYRSTDAAAPVLTGTAGTLIALLDACLVNGYGALVTSSITQTGGIATLTTINPHGYLNSPKVKVAGATPSNYNGEFTATVTGANTLTFPVTGSPGSASVQGTVSKAGSGWTKAFSGTNAASYKQPVSGSNGFYLNVDDNTTANIARARGYETMSALATGTGLFPTDAQISGGAYLFKSATLDATARAWLLYCNGPTFYFFINQASAANWTTASCLAFGDFISYKAGDVYNTVMIGGETTTAVGSRLMALSSSNFSTATPGHYIARSHTQTGTSVLGSKVTDSVKAQGAGAIGGNGLPYPNGPDGAIYTAPLWLAELTQGVRGVMPGILNPLHQDPMTHGDTYAPATGDLVGKIFEYVHAVATNQGIFLEISDTW